MINVGKYSSRMEHLFGSWWKIPFPKKGCITLRQMMIGVYNQRNARYLGSMKPFSEMVIGSLLLGWFNRDPLEWAGFLRDIQRDPFKILMPSAYIGY